MAGRAREIQVIFRVNEQERLLIRQKMELMGVRNMQAYLRKMAIDGYAVKLDLPELREADEPSFAGRCGERKDIGGVDEYADCA